MRSHFHCGIEREYTQFLASETYNLTDEKTRKTHTPKAKKRRHPKFHTVVMLCMLPGPDGQWGLGAWDVSQGLSIWSHDDVIEATHSPISEETKGVTLQ